MAKPLPNVEAPLGNIPLCPPVSTGCCGRIPMAPIQHEAMLYAPTGVGPCSLARKWPDCLHPPGMLGGWLMERGGAWLLNAM